MSDIDATSGIDNGYRQRMADVVERLATVADALAVTFEEAAVRGDQERRLAFARSERREAARLRVKASELRRCLENTIRPSPPLEGS